MSLTALNVDKKLEGYRIFRNFFTEKSMAYRTAGRWFELHGMVAGFLARGFPPRQRGFLANTGGRRCIASVTELGHFGDFLN